jgi:pyruvate dehydrogenase (quinone)
MPVRASKRTVSDQVKGFASAAGKVVLDGGVGRMLDLARSNLPSIPRP